jgi:hypothetical protein
MPGDLAVQVLGAMITPALLISACGTLVLSTSNRLSRVVERVRVLARDAERSDDAGTSRRHSISRQLGELTARALILRSALSALYLAIGFLVATGIGVGVSALADWRFPWLPVALAMAGACALLWGSVLLVREGRLAVRSTLEEMHQVQALIEKSGA